MSKLGGNSPSADTDKSNNLKGDKGDPGADSTVPGPPGADGADSTVPGPPGADGVVATVVGGTNCSVDSGDVGNPIINADAKASPTTTKGDVVARGTATDERVAVGTDGQVLVADSASSAGVKFSDAAGGGQNTTKGDLEGYDTGAARIPVGTDGQVLTADSVAALGLKWADAAGGGGSAAIEAVKPNPGFFLGGAIAQLPGTQLDLTFTGDQCHIDFVYFSEATTTVTELHMGSDTASLGGTVIVGLHPLTARVALGNQSHVASVTIGTGSNSIHIHTIPTPWVINSGWYALVTWSPSNITNVVHKYASTDSGMGGPYTSARIAFFTVGSTETERRLLFLQNTDYDVTPNALASVDFNDITLWKSSPATGEIGATASCPIVMLKISSTT